MDERTVPDVAGRDIGADRLPPRELQGMSLLAQAAAHRHVVDMILRGARFDELYSWARDQRRKLDADRQAPSGPPLADPDVVDVGTEGIVYGRVHYRG